jgi:pimeloyl-ACP methyl ester carboxylesterase
VEELIDTYAADGVALEGVLYPATSDLALVYIHGVSGSVFRPTHVRIARALQSAGWTVVAGNNRGTGLATPLLQPDGSRRLGGSWYERLADSVSDIAAWMDVAASRGAGRIALFGHSLGATKVVLYASDRRDDRLAGVVLASGSFNFTGQFAEHEGFAEASRAVEQNRPNELIEYGPPTGPTLGLSSAGTFVDRASGIADPWAEPSRFRRIACPVLAFYGSDDIGGPQDLERIRQHVSVPFTGSIVDGANHMYAGHEADVAAIVAAWLRSLAGVVEAARSG